MIKTDSINLTKWEKGSILFSSFIFSVCLILLDADETMLSYSVYVIEIILCSFIYTCVMCVPIYGIVMFYKSIVRDIKYEITVFKSRKKYNE